MMLDKTSFWLVFDHKILKDVNGFAEFLLSRNYIGKCAVRLKKVCGSQSNNYQYF